VLRGYMLDWTRYKGLYNALKAVGAELLNNSWEYGHGHYWNLAYSKIRDFAVRSHFFPGKDLTHANALRFCEHGAWFMKDYVKSAKGKGFIPDIRDAAQFERAKAALLEARGDQFYDGICLKQTQQFAKGLDGNPLEVRVFYCNGHFVSACETHGGGAFDRARIPYWVRTAARRMGSNFFSLDLGFYRDGTAVVLEAGDGGVSGLSPAQDAYAFYTNLYVAVVIGNVRLDFADLYPNLTRADVPPNEVRSFPEALRNGYGDEKWLDDEVDRWHDGNSNLPVSAYLGLTKLQWTVYVAAGFDALVEALRKD
jgi:hypothetical protein